MKIQSIQATNQNSNFKAKLYNYDGERILNFDAKYPDFYIRRYGLKNNYTDVVSCRGNKNTEIHIEDFKSKKGFVIYDNLIKFNISNPLLGEKTSFEYPADYTSKPIKGNKKLEMKYLDNLTFSCRRLEDNLLKNSLMQTIQKLSKKRKAVDLNPIHIFNERLKNCDYRELGFDITRIEEFKTIAKNLLIELIEDGSDKNTINQIIKNSIKRY